MREKQRSEGTDCSQKSGYGMTVVAFVSLNRMLGVWYVSPAS
jgi:hypothetical protein